MEADRSTNKKTAQSANNLQQDASFGDLSSDWRRRAAHKDADTRKVIDAYTCVEKISPLIFNPPLDISSLIGGDGRTRVHFPLPGGGASAKPMTVGLPNPCREPLLERMFKAEESRGVYLTFSAFNLEGNRENTTVLLEYSSTRDARIITAQDLQVEALVNLYQQLFAGKITTQLPLDMSCLISNLGKLQRFFPLPTGGTIEVPKGVGLPISSSAPRLNDIALDDVGRGVWITFAALDDNEQLKSSKVLFLSGKKRFEAVQTEEEVHAEALKALYQQVIKGEQPSKLPLDVRSLFLPNGQSKSIFPLPNGKNAGKHLALALPHEATATQIDDIQKAEDDSGLWITFSAYNRDGKRQSTTRLFRFNTEDAKSHLSEQDIQVNELRSLYQRVEAEGAITGISLDVSLLVSKNGTAQYKFPLRNGGTLGDNSGLGLPDPSTNPVITAIEKLERPSAFKITFAALDANQQAVTSRMLLLSDVKGRSAFRTETEQQAENLVYLYSQVTAGIPIDYLPLDISSLFGKRGKLSSTFPFPSGERLGAATSIGFNDSHRDFRVDAIHQDTSDRGVWITISASYEKNSRESVKILLRHGAHGREAVRTPLDVQIDNVREVYDQVGSESKCSNLPLDISLLISPSGRTSSLFPLPGGVAIGRDSSIHLASKCHNAILEKVELSSSPKGVWLTISAEVGTGERLQSRSLFLHSEGGSQAIRSEQELQSESLTTLYRQILKGAPTTKLPLDVSLLFNSAGKINPFFPLLDGSSIGTLCAIALPSPCRNVQLEKIELADGIEGVWLTVSGLNKHGDRKNSRIILISGKSGLEAVKRDITWQAECLARLYEGAEKGLITSKLPLDVFPLVNAYGKTQLIFPLPGGLTVGAYIALRLPTQCTSVQVVDIKPSVEDGGMWVTFSGVGKDGETKTSTALLRSGRQGDDAIKFKQDLQIDELQRMYAAAAAGNEIKGLPLDISCLVLDNGKMSGCFPIPGGGTIGKSPGFGLPIRCSEPFLEELRAAEDNSGVWLTMSALNLAQERVRATFLLLSGKHGYDAVKTEREIQAEALSSLYKQILQQNFLTTALPLDISLLIGADGRTQQAFPLPDGKPIAVNTGVGLPHQCTSAKVEEISSDTEGLGIWLTVAATRPDGASKTSKFLLLFGKKHRDAVVLDRELQAIKLIELYQQAKRSELLVKLPLDITHLISSTGHTQHNFPLPGGKNLRQIRGIGLGSNIVGCSVTHILHLSDDLYRLSLEGQIPTGTTVNCTIVVSPSGIHSPTPPTPSLELAKGFLLDRYLAHLFAATSTQGITAPTFELSPLTGERRAPNIISGATIVHAKWGNRGDEVLKYAQRYARLMLWDNELKGAVYLVVSTEHLEQLRAKLHLLQSKVGCPAIEIAVFSDWAEKVLGADKVAIEQEFKRIEAMTMVGDIEWISNRTYTPTLPPGSEGPRNSLRDWRERVEALSKTSALIEALRTHQKHHSLFWEREYHLELVKVCSYLVSAVLPECPLGANLRQEARDIIYSMYPALRMFPDAWQILSEEIDERSSTRAVGWGVKPILQPFNLEKELQLRGMPSRKPVEEEVVDWGQTQDVSPKIHEFFHRYSTIEETLLQLREELKLHSSEVQGIVYRECLNWIASAVLDVRLMERFPRGLLKAKESTNQLEAFLTALAKLPNSWILYYYSNEEMLSITAGELTQCIHQLSL